MFYAPWCGHCKKLKPEFDAAATELLKNDPPVTLAKVDCTEGGKDTCSKFSVSGYPTLKIFKNGEVSKAYSGPRAAAGIVKYMKGQVGPVAKVLNTLSEVNRFLEEPEVSVIGFFKSESSLKSAFMSVADKEREKLKFRFGVTKSDEILKEYGQTDGVILFRPKHLHSVFEPSKVEYDGEHNYDALASWSKKLMHGLCDHRTQDNLDDFKNPLVVAYYGVDYAKDPKGTNYWRNRILKVAKKYADDFNFAISAKDDFQHELNEFGYDYVKSKKPVILARSATDKKYKMTEEFSVEVFEDFLKKMKAGELEAYLKSEPIPDNNDKPVVVAVGKNFDDVVLNNDKDTLIEFYAPWCGHCKNLAPVWEELGEKMIGENVAVVKMDATANDVPSPFEVRGFPTIYWAPKNSKSSPVSYNGGRAVDDFIKYIAQHSTDELKGYDRKGNPKSKDEL